MARVGTPAACRSSTVTLVQFGASVDVRAADSPSMNFEAALTVTAWIRLDLIVAMRSNAQRWRDLANHYVRDAQGVISALKVLALGLTTIERGFADVRKSSAYWLAPSVEAEVRVRLASPAMSDQILLATKKGTLILDRKNGRWMPRPIAHAGLAVSYAARDLRDGTIWACMDNAHWGPALMRSKDDGATWEDASRIAYPQGARYIEQLIPDPKAMDDAGKPITYKPATLMKVWVLGFAGKDQPGVIHAGTLPGGLFTTRDGGESWELNLPLWNHESRGGDLFGRDATSKNQWGGTPAAMAYGEFVPGIHSVVVDPRDSNHVYVAVSCAGVIETRDGGKTWAGCNKGMLNDYLPNPEAEWGHDPHFVTLSPAQPDRLWQQNHTGVFTSEDGAKTWKRVSKQDVAVHFGFPIAADDKDGKTAWVIPLRSDQERMTIGDGLLVARTSDGGASWQQFREGLPQQNCYDVVYRHALDASGDRVCFGSTTGNVYVSEDRGESWRCVGNNLPPVHSVRFA